MLFNRLIFVVVVIFQVILCQNLFSWTRSLPIINHSLITTASSKMRLSRHCLRARWLQKPTSAILMPYWDFRGSTNMEYLIKIAICRLHIAKCYLTMQKVLVFVFNQCSTWTVTEERTKQHPGLAVRSPWGCSALPIRGWTLQWAQQGRESRLIGMSALGLPAQGYALGFRFSLESKPRGDQGLAIDTLANVSQSLYYKLYWWRSVFSKFWYN